MEATRGGTKHQGNNPGENSKRMICFGGKIKESLRQRCGTMRCWRYNEVYILHFWTFPDRANDKIAFNPSQPLQISASGWLAIHAISVALKPSMVSTAF